MPFCPKCKAEYREGFDTCSDCKVKLVDKLPDYSEIEIKEELPLENVDNADSFDISDVLDENALEALNITPEMLRKWQENPPTPEELNQLKRFIIKQRMIEEENEKFVSKKEKASDYQSSGIMLLVMGALGVAFVVLAFLKVFPFIRLQGFGYVIYSVVGVVFASFIYFGISSLMKVKKTKLEAVSEDNEIEKVKSFFDTEIKANVIDENLDISDDENLNYFMRSEKIKQILKQEFPDLKEGFIDDLIDDKYNNIFG